MSAISLRSAHSPECWGVHRLHIALDSFPLWLSFIISSFWCSSFAFLVEFPFLFHVSWEHAWDVRTKPCMNRGSCYFFSLLLYLFCHFAVLQYIPSSHVPGVCLCKHSLHKQRRATCLHTQRPPQMPGTDNDRKRRKFDGSAKGRQIVLKRKNEESWKNLQEVECTFETAKGGSEYDDRWYGKNAREVRLKKNKRKELHIWSGRKRPGLATPGID